ncbi:MAG: hydroxyisourate hydrolase [Vicinamibacterales bacterium]
MAAITTHVLDTAHGRPAAGVPVTLERQTAGEQWERIGQGETDSDGRLRTLMPEDSLLIAGVYRLVFDVATYFHARGSQSFYPSVVIVFEAVAGEAHYHVPLLLSPFGYSTYRGS